MGFKNNWAHGLLISGDFVSQHKQSNQIQIMVGLTQQVNQTNTIINESLRTNLEEALVAILACNYLLTQYP